MKVVEGTASVEDVDAFVERLAAVGEDHGVAVQAVDARLVTGRAHLRAAVDHAVRAVERGENVARDPAVELLLYVAGRRQISQALAVGVDAGETPAAVVVDAALARAADPDAAGDEAGAAAAVRDLLDPEPTLGRTDEGRVRAFFDVTDAEVAATDADLSALVRERVALLDVEK